MNATVHRLTPKFSLTPPDKGGVIVAGCCKDWLEWIPDESVDLCYIDPPFFSNEDYEKIWGNGAEVRSFGDRFAGGIQHYVEWMRERVEIIHRKLKPTGSIFLHCDWHASHRLRVMLDDIFGEQNFRNEIVWRRTAAKGLTERSFPTNHDNILYYSKTDARTFKKAFRPYTEGYVEKSYNKVEKGTGRRYQLCDLTNPNPDRPNLRYEWHGHLRVWRWTKERMQAAHEAGLIEYTGNGLARQKRYLDEMSGHPVDTIWDDIAVLAAQSKERLGYPTQKPVALIKRIIECASNEGDVVLDCFGGGGTTAVACVETHRRYITGDVSPVAVKIMRDRLTRSTFQAPCMVKGLAMREEEYRAMDGHGFAALVCEVMGWKVNPKKSGDSGVDGLDGRGHPVQVKNHKSPAGRPDLMKFFAAIRANRSKRGSFVAWSYSKDAREYAALKNAEGVEIELLECQKDIFRSLILSEEDAARLDEYYRKRAPKEWLDNSSATPAAPLTPPKPPARTARTAKATPPKQRGKKAARTSKRA
jgi:DNA modification methylase